jgi:hypothetical protein
MSEGVDPLLNLGAVVEDTTIMISGQGKEW